jgi:hypothetical protein
VGGAPGQFSCAALSQTVAVWAGQNSSKEARAPCCQEPSDRHQVWWRVRQFAERVGAPALMCADGAQRSSAARPLAAAPHSGRLSVAQRRHCFAALLCWQLGTPFAFGGPSPGRRQLHTRQQCVFTSCAQVISVYIYGFLCQRHLLGVTSGEWPAVGGRFEAAWAGSMGQLVLKSALQASFNVSGNLAWYVWLIPCL